MNGELRGDRYRVEARIGRGGMGVVYRAQDTRLSRRVALKMVPDDVGRDPDLLRRLSLEARAAAAISHPGVAAIYDFEEHGQDSFIVYEYVDGTTLRDRLGKRSFSIDEVIEIGIQLAEALCAAHDHGIIHRDLKPENLMLVSGSEGRQQVKILDFGLAKWVKPLALASAADLSTEEIATRTAAGVIVGTVTYMSPEQVQAKDVDSRSDLYSLGLVLYEMATGTNPFHGEDPASTIANIVMRDPPPMPDLNPACPSEVDRIFRKCLRKSKQERYQSVHELLVDLSNFKGLKAPTDTIDRTVEQIPRGLARALFVLIQFGYLAMYITAFRFLTQVEKFLSLFDIPYLSLIVMFSATCGAVLRLYLISATALDYPNTGKLFRSVFPGVLVLDALWAASPLMLFNKYEFLVLLMSAALVCLPFSQRTLMSYAYAPRGGRISTSRRTLRAQQS